ncbi:hypothetical protein BDW72DRAFT_3077 [Aspergillus terricola var. indicus]
MYVLPVSITFVSVATFVVTLRLFTRIRLVCAPWWDDWFLVLALITDYALFGVLIAEDANGLGQPKASLTSAQHRYQLKLLWISVPLYNLSLNLTKVSMVLLYMRLFPSRHYQIMLKILLGLVACTGLYMVFGTLFVCVPVHTFWERRNVDENCVSRAVVWYLTAALQIAGDLTLVILPMPKLFRLRVPTRQKVCLILVFALGLFVVATSAARFDSLVTLVQSEDFIRANGLIATWSFVEVNVAIICASLTTFRQLIIRTFPKLIPSSTLKTGNRSDKPLHDPAIPWAPYTGPASYCADISGNASADRDSDSHTGDGIQIMRELRWELGMIDAATETGSEKRNMEPETGLGPDLEMEGQAENGQPERESGRALESAA